MIETTAGQLGVVNIRTTADLNRIPAWATREPTYQAREDLAEDSDCDMADLSDSPSSGPSLSRPTTPLHLDSSRAAHDSRPRARSTGPPPSASDKGASPEPFSLAIKAERILGLTPGTLAHAHACLQNARDEVRRLADSPPPTVVPSSSELAAGGGMRGKLDRAKKAMSDAMPGAGRVPAVVIGAGGKEEEARREKRRRATDGVLYWQREVARLEEEEEPTKKRR